MKKLLSGILAAFMLITATSAMAAPGKKPTPPGQIGKNSTEVGFYVSFTGIQFDEAGNIETRDTSYFSDRVGKSELKERQSDRFAIALGEGVTEEDILSYLVSSPADDEVFALLVQEFENTESKLKTSEGTEIAWSDLNGEDYDVEWYVLKKENDHWHVDGRIHKIGSDEEIIIVPPPGEEDIITPPAEEEDPVPPVEEEKDPVPPVEEEKDPVPPAEEEKDPVPPVEEEKDSIPPVEEEKDPVPPVEEEEDNPIILDGVDYAYIFGYEPMFGVVDGEVKVSIEMGMDDKVTVEQVSSMLMRMLDQHGDTTNKVYPMVPAVEVHKGTWYERGLLYLCSKGGFDPEKTIALKPITRGEVAKLVACALDLTKSEETPFADIADNEYKKYIEIVYHYGYMNGVGGGVFAPDAHMTRAEFCSLFNNIIGRNSYGLTALDENGEEYEVTAETYFFVDMSPSHWAYNICLKASSAYNSDGYVDTEIRLSNIRNKLDHYESQMLH